MKGSELQVGKKYAYSCETCHGTCAGVGVYNGERDGWTDSNGNHEVWYGFDLEGEDETIWFAEEDILAEVK